MATVIEELIGRVIFKVDKRSLDTFNNALNKTEKLMLGIATSATVIGAKITQKLAVPFANFEQILNQIAAAGELANDQLQKVEQQALRLGRTTRFTSREVARGQLVLTKAGIGLNTVLGATPSILKLAQSTSISIAKAADIALISTKAFGIEMSKLPRVLDVLAKASVSANLTIVDINQAMTFVASESKGLNIPLEETVKILALLAPQLRAGRAGRNLARLFIELAKNSTRIAKAFGINKKLITDSLSDPIKIIGILRDATKGMSVEQKSLAKNTAFTGQAARAFGVLAGKSAERVNQVSDSIDNSSGALNKMFNTMNRGLFPAFKEFTSAIEGLVLAIGKEMAPVLIVLLKGLTRAISLFTDLSGPLKKLIALTILAITVFGAYLTSVLLLKFALTVLPAIIQGVTVAVKLLTGSMLKLFLIPGLIIAALVAVGLIIDDIVAFARGGDSVLGVLAKRFPEVQALIEDVRQVIEENSDAFRELGFFIKGVTLTAIEGFGIMLVAAIKLIPLLANIGRALVLWIFVFQDILAVSSKFYSELFSKTREAVDIIVQAVKDVLSPITNLANFLGLTILNVLEFIKILVGEGIELLFLLWTQPQEFMQNFVQSAKNVIDAVKNLFKNFVNDIVSFFKTAFLRDLPAVIKAFIKPLSAILSTIGNFIKDPLKAAGDIVERTLKGFGGKIEDPLKDIGKTVKTPLKGIGSAIKSPLKGIGEIVKNSLQNVGNVVKLATGQDLQPKDLVQVATGLGTVTQPQTPRAPIISKSGAGNNIVQNVTNNNSVTLEAGKDADENANKILQASEDGTQRAMQSTSNNFIRIVE